jgi:hypothetical protein
MAQVPSQAEQGSRRGGRPIFVNEGLASLGLPARLAQSEGERTLYEAAARLGSIKASPLSGS